MSFKRQLPRKSVVLTFDDGYRAFKEFAYPVLKELGFTATLFVYTDYVGAGRNALSWEELSELAAEGFDVQAHSKTHGDLRKAPGETDAQFARRMQAELEQPLEPFQQRLGSRPNYLAYPYGRQDDDVVKKAKEYGYVAAFTVRRQGNPAFVSPLRGHRSQIYSEMTLEDFAKNLNVFRGRGAQVRRRGRLGGAGAPGGRLRHRGARGRGDRHARGPSRRHAVGRVRAPPPSPREQLAASTARRRSARARGRSATGAGPLEDRPHDQHGRRGGRGRAATKLEARIEGAVAQRIQEGRAALAAILPRRGAPPLSRRARPGPVQPHRLRRAPDRRARGGVAHPHGARGRYARHARPALLRRPVARRGHLGDQPAPAEPAPGGGHRAQNPRDPGRARSSARSRGASRCRPSRRPRRLPERRRGPRRARRRPGPSPRARSRRRSTRCWPTRARRSSERTTPPPWPTSTGSWRAPLGPGGPGSQEGGALPVRQGAVRPAAVRGVL